MKNEALLGGILLAFGLLALPVAVFVVGQQVFGAYEGENGLLTLTAAIWTALANGHVATWLLVLGPYLVVQLVRLGAALWRFRTPVKPVTE